ncbi:hypothetical protein BSPWISOXPB_2372 [uncultured Gammaproteobacteria bacterium]|nr:hypothetical protein BSPWISOXPB_2372 [uncultured Gammaproteobacteria bacterium]
MQATQTHPNTIPLGWIMLPMWWINLISPVYFLGGMGIKRFRQNARNLVRKVLQGLRLFKQSKIKTAK